MGKITLSILDQSPISEGERAEEALQNTVTLAQAAETFGYHRFWVSEHHDTYSLAGSSPEVLIAYLAASTNNLRLGSGGVMLSHYSPYKVAENFRVIAGLAPGRIDIGIGRAPGGMPRASIALNNGKMRDVDHYPEKVMDLLHYLYDELPKDNPLYGLKASPIIQTAPELWMLGSSRNSASLAAKMGLPYNFALFINGEEGNHFMKSYIKDFTPSKHYPNPKNIVTVHAICAPTVEDAERIAASNDLAMIMHLNGMESHGTPSPEKARAYSYSSFELAHVKENRKRMIVGTPEMIKEQLNKISDSYETDEIMLVTNAFDFQEKVHSFELIADIMA
ncbi:LLM class flavin-dependent oxidoreductase [Caldibacillus lycopersici]|uniref:LLM class flavin-dependent oxidoreductase n=1 Tax=Perspicuibacillus lycopersici TaxID=1325689 RepID=A0AAE3IVR3_9BACI|nr:LLM class flavin-dependent oxidoreductase [Perspicuibacillus lycopersici]MCU9614271.1 LLM class flavin-dependent oxidoreductase [Perspicuibacillus lycopersici]